MATFVQYHLPAGHGTRTMLVVSGDPAQQETVTGFVFMQDGDTAGGYGSMESSHIMFASATFENTIPPERDPQQFFGGTYEP